MTTVHSLGSKLLAEFVSTFLFVAVGVGVIFTAGDNLLAVAFAHGLMIAIMVTSIAHVSGAHINPAVTVTMLALNKMPIVEAVTYLVAQLAAAVLASWTVMWSFDKSSDELAATTPTLAEALSGGQGFVLEVIGTFLLVWVIFAVAVDRDGAFFKVAGMPIGFAVSCGILFMGPLTGAAFNPARWFGPAVVSGSWDNAWIWIAGPIIGAVLAGAAYLYGIKPRLAGPAAAPDSV